MNLRKIGIAVVAVVTVGAAVVVGVGVHRNARVARDASALDAAAKPLVYECKWKRAPIRGEAHDCNAIDERTAAVKKLFADARPGQIADAKLLDVLQAYGWVPTDIDELVAGHAADLAAVRESTRCAWACQRGATHDDFRRGTSRDAMRLLLVVARRSSPDACLAIALDVVRLIEDAATGIGEMSLDAPTHVEAASTLVHCAAKADAATIERAVLDAAILASNAPPVGDALAWEAVMMATPLLTAVENPKRVGAENVLWIQRGFLVDAADALIARIDTWRAYASADFPALFDRLEGDLPPVPYVPFASHNSSGYSPSAGDMVGSAHAALRKSLLASASFHRRLRMNAVALAALRDRIATGKWSESGPTERDLPALRDPIGGAPFAWAVDGAVAKLHAPAARDAAADTVTLDAPPPH